jgi:hypothetical protein
LAGQAEAKAADQDRDVGWPTRSSSTFEIFHNRQRRRSALGMVTPIGYESSAQPEVVTGYRLTSR